MNYIKSESKSGIIDLYYEEKCIGKIHVKRFGLEKGQMALKLEWDSHKYKGLKISQVDIAPLLEEKIRDWDLSPLNLFVINPHMQKKNHLLGVQKRGFENSTIITGI